MSIFRIEAKKIAIVVLSVVISFAFVSVAVNGATTISTNIVTGGTLSVTGLTSMIQASSTRMSVFDTAYFGGSATSTFDSSGNLSVIGTLGVTGNTTLSGTLGVTGNTTLSGTLGVAGATTLDELTQGGSVLATSTDGTATTFKESDLLTYSTWEVTVNITDLTYTFPASSTLTNIIPSAGDSRTWTIINATSTAGIDVIFAAGTGSAIKAAGAGALILDEDSHGEITLTRKADSDIVILVKFPDAD